MKKNIKTFEQHLTDYYLSLDIDKDKKINTINIYKKYYERLYLNSLLMIDVVNKNNINENQEDVVISLNRNDFINDVDEFYDSYRKSNKIEFLSPYSKEELSKFKLFKLRSFNIGFAIKSNGDIILVHNNEKSIGGIGNILIKKAVEMGGTHLDHFDGFLTGFYKKNGFTLHSNDFFNSEFAPKNWNYIPVNIYDKDFSIYAEEKKVSDSEFNEAEIRYEAGMVDIIYRKFNYKNF